MNSVIGRTYEQEKLRTALEREESQLIIVSGRRRVGKTFLINEFFDNDFAFKFTGAFNSTKKQQLKNFALELAGRGELSSIKKAEMPEDWTEAFFMLRDHLEKHDDGKKQVVFFDEMPWMDTPKSGFLAAFEWFWNSWAGARKNLVFIVSGSSTAWLTENIDHNKGGLFNRCTCRLYLDPFDLAETEKFLISKNIYWSRYDIAQCYMILGGIPYYLNMLDRGYSLNENIDALFFKKGAQLGFEFEQLYNTLFSNSDKYIKVVEALGGRRGGMTRTQISKKTGIPANGMLSAMLTNLVNSGFVRVNNEFGNKKREKSYQLSDYYTHFYLRFIADNAGRDEHLWSNTNDNPARRAWEGLTFEQLCKDHIDQIKNKLGISGVMTEISSWRREGDAETGGAQIDLLIDRRDGVINLCEIKFSNHEYEVDKEYDLSLKNKVSVFREATGTRKTIQVTMITTYGIKRNMYSNYVGKVIELDDLFKMP